MAGMELTLPPPAPYGYYGGPAPVLPLLTAFPKPPSEAAFLQTAGAACRGASFFAPQQAALTDQRLIPVYKRAHG